MIIRLDIHAHTHEAAASPRSALSGLPLLPCQIVFSCGRPIRFFLLHQVQYFPHGRPFNGLFCVMIFLMIVLCKTKYNDNDL
jgi:hypothetical protein